jgi:hypothetical protein
LLKTTKSGYCGIPDYVEKLALADEHKDSPYRTRKAVIDGDFDQICGDIRERFLGTLGKFRALAVLSKNIPLSHSKTVEEARRSLQKLYSRARGDFEFLDDQCSFHAQGDGLEVICERAIAWFTKRIDYGADIIQKIDDMKQPLSAGVESVFIFKQAVRPILMNAVKDYIMLVEQYESWLSEVAFARENSIPDLTVIRWADQGFDVQSRGSEKPLLMAA